MDLRFFQDPETRQPHIYGHGVNEREVEEVLSKQGEDYPGNRGSRQKLGQTSAGRFLKVIYVPDETPMSAFVIPAYDLGDKAKKAYRKRQRRKGR